VNITVCERFPVAASSSAFSQAIAVPDGTNKLRGTVTVYGGDLAACILEEGNDLQTWTGTTDMLGGSPVSGPDAKVLDPATVNTAYVRVKFTAGASKCLVALELNFSQQ
jgi:hypothetical protein